MSSTACRREWIFRHRSSDDVPDVCPEGWWSWAGELLLGGAQLSDGRYYQWRFFMSQWVISFIEVIIAIVLSLTNCIGLVSLIYKNSVSKSVRVLWNAFMTLRSSGKCFKSCNFLSLITLIVLNENARTNPNHESLLWWLFPLSRHLQIGSIKKRNL